MKYLKVKDITDMLNEIDKGNATNTIFSFARTAILMRLEENMISKIDYKIVKEDIKELAYDFISGDFWDIIDDRVDCMLKRFKVKERK